MKTIDIIIATIDHIENHLEEDLSLGGIAQRLGYSRFYLHRLFSRTVGMSMHIYIQRRRLTQAAQMLADSDLPIVEIALLTGYESQQAFSMAFKAMYKLAPRQFRQKRIFYPLQCAFEFDASAIEMHAVVNRNLNSTISLAKEDDIQSWMQLLRQITDGFPCLDETEHEATLRSYIKLRNSYIMTEQGSAIGIMMISPEKGNIDFLGIHPFFRHGQTMPAFIAKAMNEMPTHKSLCITTYRQGDKADTGHRKELEKLGFTEGELLTEFGYPTQRMQFH